MTVAALAVPEEEVEEPEEPEEEDSLMTLLAGGDLASSLASSQPLVVPEVLANELRAEARRQGISVEELLGMAVKSFLDGVA
jgi:hypothetical protein